jgi:hypothetical protein
MYTDWNTSYRHMYIHMVSRKQYSGCNVLETLISTDFKRSSHTKLHVGLSGTVRQYLSWVKVASSVAIPLKRYR